MKEEKQWKFKKENEQIIRQQKKRKEKNETEMYDKKTTEKLRLN